MLSFFRIFILCMFLFSGIANAQYLGVKGDDAIKWGNEKGQELLLTLGIENIVEKAREAGKPVFMKDSLKPIYGEEIITEFPWD